MPDYVLYPKAAADLEEIYFAGLTQFGAPQAQRYQRELHGRFQLLAEFPGIAGSQLRGLSRPLYRFPFGSHIILFEKAEDGVAIVRVFQARMDWLRYLQDE
ncbi:MAG: type II toxin-antitoxin system RelE/ParE family toxin [Rhodomicrobium sp.]